MRIERTVEHAEVGIGKLSRLWSSAEVQLWDIARSKKLRTLRGHGADITALSWNKFVLSSGSKDTSVINHDVRLAQAQIGTLRAHTHTVCGLKWSPDGQQLASGGKNLTILVFL